MASALIAGVTKPRFLRVLANLDDGALQLVCGDETHQFGSAQDPLQATMVVHNDQFFKRAVLGGDIGIGESYMHGEWTTPDLVSVVRLGVRNLDDLENSNRFVGTFRRWMDFLAHLRNRNTQKGSRRNISYHYDLGNDFYQLFLDTTLSYSCAYFASPADSLETAQLAKLDLICRKLQLNPNDHLLEIGTGWGGLALYAARNYGCRVTTTTISREQHAYAQHLFSTKGPHNRINLLFEDYRNLKGTFDKIVSVEMFEAVGADHYDSYFGACDRLLDPNGAMLLQTITIRESKFEQYRSQSDWIKKYIFPGAELAAILPIVSSLNRCTRLQMFDLEDIGLHYALTLREWRLRFLQNLEKVRHLGFDENFIRMWEYYLAYCEGAFLERYIGDVQLVLARAAAGRSLSPVPRQHPIPQNSDKHLPFSLPVVASSRLE